MFNQKTTATPPAGRRYRRAGRDGRVSRRTGARIASPDPVRRSSRPASPAWPNCRSPPALGSVRFGLLVRD